MDDKSRLEADYWQAFVTETLIECHAVFLVLLNSTLPESSSMNAERLRIACIDSVRRGPDCASRGQPRLAQSTAGTKTNQSTASILNQSTGSILDARPPPQEYW